MTENSRFEGLKKFPAAPAAAVLARSGAKLQTPLDADREAPVAVVLAELDTKEALVDMLQLIAHALPPREATWWACLAARDLVPASAERPPAPLAAAEAWVFKPGDETRAAARKAMEAAPPDDDTALCAMAATFADGTVGPGELAEYAAPAGATGGAVLGIVLKALFADPDAIAARGALLVERALDIARGGNGKVAPDAASGARGAEPA